MIKIDARGKTCPIPVIETKKVLKNIEENGSVLTIVDNEIAKENLEKMAKVKGYEVESKTISNEHYEVKIVKGLEVEEAGEKEEDVIISCGPRKTVVVISSDKMGEGNEELGRVLIKGFIYALSELENLPKTIIFYNGGVKLSCEGSASLEDLKKMESEGVEIISCGTCLDYNNLTDKLAVGSVSNMYQIVETMDGADKILKP